MECTLGCDNRSVRKVGLFEKFTRLVAPTTYNNYVDENRTSESRLSNKITPVPIRLIQPEWHEFRNLKLLNTIMK